MINFKQTANFIWEIANLLFIADKEVVTKAGIVKTLYDPAGGTGGMLTVSEVGYSMEDGKTWVELPFES